MIAIALSHSTFAQAAPDIQKILDRLDKLEHQNKELLSWIRELRKQLAEGNSAATESSASIPSLSEQMDEPEARTADLAQSKVEAFQKVAAVTDRFGRV